MNVLFKGIRRDTIYVELLNEGTSVWRPASALQVGPHTYVVLLTQDYDPATEEWRFPPGSLVVCEKQTRDGKDVLVAKSPPDV